MINTEWEGLLCFKCDCFGRYTDVSYRKTFFFFFRFLELDELAYPDTWTGRVLKSGKHAAGAELTQTLHVFSNNRLIPC